MDRFRVKALEKLILNHELNSKQKKVALKSLTSRLEIIINGAKKRNNRVFKDNGLKQRVLFYWESFS